MSGSRTLLLTCCGAGGVGKTTVSAALALRLAREGRRVAVLTVDPARRLADSLGLGDRSEAMVPLGRDAPSSARLDAFMLEAHETFDRVVRELAPSPEAAERILANRLYRFVSRHLSGTQEYTAMYRLLELARSGRYEVVVLDTPPSRQAVDFLTAPGRVARVMDQRVLHFLALPRTHAGLQRLWQRSATAMRALDRLVGADALRAIADFVSAFDGMTDSFRDLALEALELLRGPGSRFLLVTAPLRPSIREALEFQAFLAEHGLPLWGFAVNRCTPSPRWPEPLPPDSPLLPADPELASALRAAPVLFAALARAEEQVLGELRERSGGLPLLALPLLEGLDRVEGLLGLGERLPGLEDFFGGAP